MLLSIISAEICCTLTEPEFTFWRKNFPSNMGNNYKVIRCLNEPDGLQTDLWFPDEYSCPWAGAGTGSWRGQSAHWLRHTLYSWPETWADREIGPRWLTGFSAGGCPRPGNNNNTHAHDIQLLHLVDSIEALKKYHKLLLNTCYCESVQQSIPILFLQLKMVPKYSFIKIPEVSPETVQLLF